MSNTEIATTIRDQLGHKCLYMLGAKHLAAGPNYLSFRIRGSKKANHICVELEPSDTYLVKFSKIRNVNVTTVAVHSGIYVDQLHCLIEEVTGLRTSL